jgi:hypothetical protein
VVQTYRGELSYIVKDPTTHKYFRFRPLEVAVMRALQQAATAADAVATLAEEGIRVTAATVSKFAERLKAYGIDLGTMLFSNLGERGHAPARGGGHRW